MISKEDAQRLINEKVDEMFEAGENVDPNLIYDMLYEWGFRGDEAVDMVDEAVFYAVGE